MHPFPMPAAASLAGKVVFGQWAHLIGGPQISATDGFALHRSP